MIWAVLVGNTRTVAGLMRGKRVLQRRVIPTASLRRGKGALAWVKSLRLASPVEGLVVASVVPPLDSNLRKSLQKVFGKRTLFINHRNCGIAVRVHKPSQVGADRLANAVAARFLYGAPVIVVDYGTGTTFDVINSKGAYVGGAILPGLGISLRALHDFTAKIPLVKFKKVSYVVGRSTEEAVRSGIYHGAIGTTRELLSRIRKELGKRAPAVATGGWCGVFKNTPLFYRIDLDLTHAGMALIWEKNHA